MLLDLIVTAHLLACVIVLNLVALRWKRHPDSIYWLMLVAFGLGLLVWVPPTARSLTIGGFCVLVMMCIGRWYGAIALGAVIAISLWLPGGMSGLLLATIAILGITQIVASRRHLTRLSRAKTLVANEPVDVEVELTGMARAVYPTVDPVHGRRCAMWKLVAGTTRASDGPIELRGETGSAIIDPTTVQIAWSREVELIDGDRAAAITEKLGLDLPEDGAIALYVLPEDTECYVIGTPSWEMAPASTVGLYRDGPILPAFRSTPDRPAWFADRSETELRRDFKWTMLVWGTWGVTCAAIAAAQIAGWT